MWKRLLFVGMAFVAVLGLICVSVDARAAMEEPSSDLIGNWSGKITASGQSIAIRFRFVTNSDGQIGGAVDSPDQGEYGLVVSDVQVSHGRVEFDVPAVGGRYVANLEGPNDKLVGKWSQAGGEFPLTMIKGAEATDDGDGGVQAERVIGDWTGVIVAGGQELHVVFHIRRIVGPTLGGTIDSVDQSALDIPIAKVELIADNVTVYVPEYKSRFAGAVGKDGTVIDGIWNQADADFVLVLRKSDPSQPSE